MEEPIKKQRKINKKKLVIAIIIILVIIAITTIFTIYCMNANFRKWADKNVLNKEIKQGNTATIEFNGENTSNVYAFDKYIVILENKILNIYNASGTKEEEITTDIINPLFASNGKYLVIAENSGESLYLFEGKKMLWSTSIEGKISAIQTNENGYVGVVISDMSYKNIVSIYNNTDGKSLFKTYVATNKVIDITISKNNKYLAIAEMDISGIINQSSIKIIDIEKAKTDPSNSIVNTYFADIGKLIVDIEYQNKEKLLCTFNDSINVIENNINNTIIKFENNQISFASVNLRNDVITIEEKQKGDFSSNLNVNVMNTTTQKIRNYQTEEVAKEIYTYENVIGLNFGTELHIINTNGWLMKKYISEHEINNVVISSKIVGIIYRDKIEIIKL